MERRSIGSIEALRRSASGRPAYTHTVTLRLTSDQYRTMRYFIIACEERLGGRLTHQTLLEAALNHYITITNDELAKTGPEAGREDSSKRQPSMAIGNGAFSNRGSH